MYIFVVYLANKTILPPRVRQTPSRVIALRGQANFQAVYILIFRPILNCVRILSVAVNNLMDIRIRNCRGLREEGFVSQRAFN